MGGRRCRFAQTLSDIATGIAADFTRAPRLGSYMDGAPCKSGQHAALPAISNRMPPPDRGTTRAAPSLPATRLRPL